jgi:acetate kinase
METTFIVNPGSTSRKYALYIDGVCIVVLYYESTGDTFQMSVIRNGIQVENTSITESEFALSAEKAIEYLCSKGDVANISAITKVGVRVVAPGSYFVAHKVIDEEYIDELKAKEDIAPLHIPGLINEIHSVQKALPDCLLCGISDSAFHNTIPEYVSTVSIPKADAQEYDIKRFGYHGLSFASIARKLQEKQYTSSSKVIACHIGGGVSVAALEDGKSIATSMGYSPVSGMLMGSRGGDITAGVVAALTTLKNLKGKELYEYLYKESGFKGVTGVSDLRVVLERRASCDEDARLAIDMFVYQIRSWIARHAVQLGGIDTVVLTATASVRNPALRKLILSDLTILGIKIDDEKNDALIGNEGYVHSEESSVKVLVLKTDEMGEIEKECRVL